MKYIKVTDYAKNKKLLPSDPVWLLMGHHHEEWVLVSVENIPFMDDAVAVMAFVGEPRPDNGWRPV